LSAKREVRNRRKKNVPKVFGLFRLKVVNNANCVKKERGREASLGGGEREIKKKKKKNT